MQLNVVSLGPKYLSFVYFAHRKKKEFVILTIVFLTRIATVDMVLWDDARIVSPL